MLQFVFFSCLIFSAITIANSEEPIKYPETEKPAVRILSYRNIQNVDGSYTFEYEAEDGSKRSEQGYFKEPSKSEEGRAQIVEGTYSYTDPNGDLVKIQYVADEKGFRPNGNVIHPAITSYLQRLDLANGENNPQEEFEPTSKV